MKPWCAIIVFLLKLTDLAIASLDFPVYGEMKQCAVTKIESQCDGHNYPLVPKILGLRFDNCKVTANLTITAIRDIKSELQASLDIQKCKNGENLDTCEPYLRAHHDYLCALLMMPPWNILFDFTEPRFKCPIEKNVYRVTDQGANIKDFILLSKGSAYWRIKLSAKEKTTGRPAGCFVVEGYTKKDAD